MQERRDVKRFPAHQRKSMEEGGCGYERVQRRAEVGDHGVAYMRVLRMGSQMIVMPFINSQDDFEFFKVSCEQAR